MIGFTDEESLGRLADLIAERVATKLAEKTQRRFVSREEFAKSNGLGMRTVDRAISENRLPVERVGRRVMIPAGAMISAR